MNTNYDEMQKILKEKEKQIFSAKEESRLDNLYYRTPAKPYLCSGYKTVSRYNNCSFDQVRNIADPTRTDYTFKQNLILADEYQKVITLTNYPDRINEILGEEPNDQIRFLSKYPILIPLFAKKFPQLATNYNNYISKKNLV